jgi:hypothetical protein
MWAGRNEMLILKAKTHKAKTLLKRWGNQWEIIPTDRRGSPGVVLVKSTRDKTGNKLNLAQSARNINLEHDEDFEVEVKAG